MLKVFFIIKNGGEKMKEINPLFKYKLNDKFTELSEYVAQSTTGGCVWQIFFYWPNNPPRWF